MFYCVFFFLGRRCGCVGVCVCVCVLPLGLTTGPRWWPSWPLLAYPVWDDFQSTLWMALQVSVLPSRLALAVTAIDRSPNKQRPDDQVKTRKKDRERDRERQTERERGGAERKRTKNTYLVSFRWISLLVERKRRRKRARLKTLSARRFWSHWILPGWTIF